MNILLISECSGKALPETRRLLDQFAERRGERTWQASVTQLGLDTIRTLLRRTARRNTAVACHWIRGRNRSELLWVVGNASRFNAEGAVPTNTTLLDVRRASSENDWQHGEVIRLLAKLSGLFHDLGKASKAFQNKLKHVQRAQPVADAYRHEWVSLRMFLAFVSQATDDGQWLIRLAEIQPKAAPDWLLRIVRDDQGQALNPFSSSVPPLAQAIGWLVVSHHSLPSPREPLVHLKQLSRIPMSISASWNRSREDATEDEKAACWNFDAGTAFASASWCADVRRAAQALLKHGNSFRQNWLDDPYVAHLARLCLILADHHYSSLPADASRGDRKFALYANTDRQSGALKQRLDEHLMGVAYHAGYVARMLPRLERELPRLARHKGFARRGGNPRFAWQDRAFDLATSLRQASAENGFFGVNMASTGRGKTLANGRILYALADPQRGARFCIALGLRTLTLQTGEAYRQRLALGADVLAVRVGGVGVRELFEYSRAQNADEQAQPDDLAERYGSASAQSLLGDDTYVHYEGSLPDSPLTAWIKDSPGATALLNAPILVCTIDHLMPATEGTRGGQHIAPMLRLMTSDLVLDEPDDFDLADLPALSRLVHWSAMLGGRVLLSSATLPPALVEGLFAAYRAGRRIYQNNRGVPGRPLEVACAWFDEHGCRTRPCVEESEFAQEHRAFVGARLLRLREQEQRRAALIVPVTIATGQPRGLIRQQWADAMLPLMRDLHEQHASVDPISRKRVSFGLVRIANIDRLIDVALRLFGCGLGAGVRLHLCCYHSQHPTLVRAEIERLLDRCLNRVDDSAVFSLAEIRERLAHGTDADHLFVVLATPVAEVGRDHDYDWAIVEPSSVRSIIQLAGRVRRHRKGECASPNVALMDTNLRSLEQPGQVAYWRPGFERPECRLNSHRLTDLLHPEQYTPLDAASRIAERTMLDPQRNLADLEHAQLAALMGTVPADGRWPASLFWQRPLVHLTAVLQNQSPFRSGGKYQRYFLEPNDDGDLTFKRCEPAAPPVAVNTLLRNVELPAAHGVEAWGATDYVTLVETLAQGFNQSPGEIAERLGGVDLRPNDQGWRYHPALGFGRVLV